MRVRRASEHDSEAFRYDELGAKTKRWSTFMMAQQIRYGAREVACHTLDGNDRIPMVSKQVGGAP
jgi:hypothetical protein